jgi:transposase InsO family protein
MLGGRYASRSPSPRGLASWVPVECPLILSFVDNLRTETGLDEVVLPEREVRSRVFRYTEGFYNRRRRHSTLGGVGIEQLEKRTNCLGDKFAA